MPASPFVLRVVSPIVFPIAAAAGAILVVTPRHPTHTLTVLTPDARRVVRHRHMEDALWYSPLMRLDAENAVTFLLAADRHAARGVEA